VTTTLGEVTSCNNIATKKRIAEEKVKEK